MWEGEGLEVWEGKFRGGVWPGRLEVWALRQL